MVKCVRVNGMSPEATSALDSRRQITRNGPMQIHLSASTSKPSQSAQENVLSKVVVELLSANDGWSGL
jgi:hypothetical protein